MTIAVARTYASWLTPASPEHVLPVSSMRLCGSTESQPLLARFSEVLGPFVIDTLRDAFMAAKLCNAVLSAQPSRTILIFSSDEYCLRGARLMSLMIFSPGLLVGYLIFHSLAVTMSQKHFLIKSPYLNP